MKSNNHLLRSERTAGLLMIGAMALALTAANSPLQPIYELIHHTPVHVRFGPLIIDEPLVVWINEGLMVIFFLLVGLEIKRELLEGQLRTPALFALPGLAAFGGMALPAAIYATINWNDPLLLRGWAIPTATDIVLALGILSFFNARIPHSLKVFLMAVAVFDDIGAVFIIGLFYGQELALFPLTLAAIGGTALVGLNIFNIVRPAAYVFVGLFLWVSTLKAGIEPALVGVLIGLAVPLRVPDRVGYSPLGETERQLRPWGYLCVVPLFAFFNSGVSFSGAQVETLFNKSSVGIMTGLFLGKQLGIFVAAWIAVQLRLAQLPDEISWAQLYGVALLGGIGFTMSLFVSSLAFTEPSLIQSSRFAILTGSILSAVTGMIVLYRSTMRRNYG